MVLSERSQSWKNTHQVTPFISSSKLGKKNKTESRVGTAPVVHWLVQDFAILCRACEFDHWALGREPRSHIHCSEKLKHKRETGL